MVVRPPRDCPRCTEARLPWVRLPPWVQVGFLRNRKLGFFLFFPRFFQMFGICGIWLWVMADLRVTLFVHVYVCLYHLLPEIILL